ncbi:hypothetical protein DUNSADRAFT_2557 [Dunaliella salina]|uniref:Uncharacterized protein n=1 Tax=Dunaliella salina TaxID=3046 RepID=A0ABQ7GVD2_DUNSA|nr:hypothetical protein DUNSADRAFT_2557 [Dunaliella salina]|eukprot:KAF5838573.1 hypothetical protein DUNSADRAFT_2557 [Dunaliella salina]
MGGASLLLCLLLNLFALTIWRAVKQTVIVLPKQDHHNTQRPAWWRRQNVRTLRSSYLAAITLYVLFTSWAQLLGTGAAKQLGVPQAVGLLLAGMLVLAACFAAAVALIPALHEALEMYHPIFSTAIFALGVTHCTCCQLVGALRMGSFWEPALIYVLFWLLDDTPPDASMPQLFTACAMQTTVVSGGSISVLLVMRLKGVLASYMLLGSIAMLLVIQMKGGLALYLLLGTHKYSNSKFPGVMGRGRVVPKGSVFMLLVVRLKSVLAAYVLLGKLASALHCMCHTNNHGVWRLDCHAAGGAAEGRPCIICAAWYTHAQEAPFFTS